LKALGHAACCNCACLLQERFLKRAWRPSWRQAQLTWCQVIFA
jgi:hypothetical protein